MCSVDYYKTSLYAILQEGQNGEEFVLKGRLSLPKNIDLTVNKNERLIYNKVSCKEGERLTRFVRILPCNDNGNHPNFLHCSLGKGHTMATENNKARYKICISGYHSKIRVDTYNLHNHSKSEELLLIQKFSPSFGPSFS
jgi:hypothetical protein